MLAEQKLITEILEAEHFYDNDESATDENYLTNEAYIRGLKRALEIIQESEIEKINEGIPVK